MLLLIGRIGRPRSVKAFVVALPMILIGVSIGVVVVVVVFVVCVAAIMGLAVVAIFRPDVRQKLGRVWRAVRMIRAYRRWRGVTPRSVVDIDPSNHQ